MNREIKFRAWDEYKNEMFIPKKLVWWETGLRCNARMGLVKGNEIPVDEKGSLSNANNIVLMQYTGLKDKNGKEIYEGDVMQTTIDEYDDIIVEEDEWGEHEEPYHHKKEVHRNIVEWEPLYGRFSHLPSQLDTLSRIHWEVVGNIYENPELLNHDR